MTVLKRLIVPVFLVSLVIPITGSLLGMGENMKQRKTAGPSGVLYFSNGASIEKLDLKTRERVVIISCRDREGKQESNSTFPVYSSKENKMYFFRSYMGWPVRRQFVAFDLKTQKEEAVQNLDHHIEALSLSPDGQWFAYFRGGGFINPYSQEVKPARLIVRDSSMRGEEKEVEADINPRRYRQMPIWVSNGEVLYRNISEHIIRVNILNKEKKDMGFKGLEAGAASPDGKQVILIVRKRKDNDGSKIHLFDLEQERLELVKRFSYFRVQGPLGFIWSPDGKSFIYTHQSWGNMLPFHEIGNLYWYDLATKKEIKLADTVSLAGGFWLAEDPAESLGTN